ncbi:hypothetical protein [Acuticoccus mangrovi]|uniref:Uncharacterized protein n=1 Tax=Acuticoccus mangrovi TaxID=2796142 RepID=A0A934IHC5_9HYPH|nr:hypothetical protein [Acuticoccus mangrovi]MBJ3775006.1 hypothetical protein [Acuticoccus mangrovi]
MVNAQGDADLDYPVDTADEGTLRLSPEQMTELVSRTVSVLLTSDADATLDLSQTKRSGTAMSEALANGYLATLSALLPDKAPDDDPYGTVIKALMRRVAALEADLLLIKSSLASDRKFVFGEGKGYADPIVALNALHADLEGLSTGPTMTHVEVPLGHNVLGRGWHPVEELPSGKFWRWSGPDLRASLLLPSLGVGHYEIGFDYQVLDPTQLDELTITVNGHAVENIVFADPKPVKGYLSFEIDIAETEQSSFLFLELTMARCVQPSAMLGSADTRFLGIGVGTVLIDRAPA